MHATGWPACSMRLGSVESSPSGRSSRCWLPDPRKPQPSTAGRHCWRLMEQDPKQANNRKYRMPDESNCTPEEAPSSERDDGGDHRHSGLLLTKFRGFPENPRGNTRSRLREIPDGNRVNFSSPRTRFASSLTCDRCAILIKRNVVAGFPSSAHSPAGRKGLLPVH